MYQRKFVADTIEDALKQIKREMGPDAIILKKTENTGLKGAFKKNRVEIIAAISEQNYVKKSKVDVVLDNDQKDIFYSDSASNIKQSIDQMASPMNAYSKLGGHRPVKSVQNDNIAKGLDAFLSDVKPEPVDNRPSMDDFLSHEEMHFEPAVSEVENPRPVEQPVQEKTPRQENTYRQEVENNFESEEMGIKLDIMEKQLFELKKAVENLERKEPTGVYQLRTTLRSLDISDQFINFLIRKTAFDLSEEEREKTETVFEYALHEMDAMIKTDAPLFSKVNEDQTPVITVLLSDISSGQTSMMLKLGALKPESELIQKCKKNQEKNCEFYEKIFGLKVVQCAEIPEVVASCRKAHQEGRSVIIDYKSEKNEVDETKKFVEGLKRSFSHVEVLVSLSAIHSELYNKRVVSEYLGLADGMVMSHLDLCLNFGALFNLSESFKELPYKFFGTGNVVPDDLEAATAARILAGIFNL